MIHGKFTLMLRGLDASVRAEKKFMRQDVVETTFCRVVRDFPSDHISANLHDETKISKVYFCCSLLPPGV